MGGRSGRNGYKWKGVIKIHHGEIRGEDECVIRFAQSVVHLSYRERKTILWFLLRWEILCPALY